MNTMLAIIALASQLGISHTGQSPSVLYVPVGQVAQVSGCYALGSADGVVMYCQQENKIIVLATNNKELID